MHEPGSKIASKKQQKPSHRNFFNFLLEHFSFPKFWTYDDLCGFVPALHCCPGPSSCKHLQAQTGKKQQHCGLFKMYIPDLLSIRFLQSGFFIECMFQIPNIVYENHLVFLQKFKSAYIVNTIFSKKQNRV